MRRAVLGLAIVASIVLTGCSSYNESRGKGDAPVLARDDEPKEVINFPDGFSNVAHACDGHGHRVFVTTRSDTSREMFVLADDTCDGEAG